ncbi:hypothetical protein FHW20_004575 [Ochrobactrum intermedium]|uniref:Uncharacterized protein n=1 Tax=Brucella intermedia TaxID=94625 RepID=A0ABR6AW28_9HYPH|nr:hypothetical protein [Brucella intermedia]
MPVPKFLAVYTMKPEDLASFRRLPKAEQDAVDAEGLVQWVAWEERNAAVILDHGGMVGKTTRVTKHGIAEAKKSGGGSCNSGGCGEAVSRPSAHHGVSRRRRRYHAFYDVISCVHPRRPGRIARWKWNQSCGALGHESASC